MTRIPRGRRGAPSESGMRAQLGSDEEEFVSDPFLLVHHTVPRPTVPVLNKFSMNVLSFK